MERPFRTLLLWLSLGLLVFAKPSIAASFDCNKATTNVETMICAGSDLGLLDERMAEAYREALAAAGDDSEAREHLTAEQRQWLKSRNGCTTAACLTESYQARIQVLSGQIAQDMGLVSLKESGPHYEIEAKFPNLMGSSTTVRALNQEIRGFVEGVLREFWKDVNESLSEIIADANAPDSTWEVRDWSLSIESGAPHRTERLLAIPFSGYDYRGGAHGMPVLDVLTVDLATGQRVSNEALFAPGSDWLGFLSELCLRELKRQFDEKGFGDDDDWLRRGTEPKPENYGLLFPGPDGLVVTFPPYQVAPYAMGPSEVLIPYADLQGILNPKMFGP